MKFSVAAYVAGLALPAFVSAQLSGTVGPTTSTASKAAKKVCNVMSYGAKATTSGDLGPALQAAWAACKAGGEVYVPAGSYGMATWQTLTGGKGVAIRIDGTIYRTGTAGGHMIIVENSSDIEIYSSNAQGAIQGYGYQFHQKGTYGPRIFRMVSVTDFSIHDLALVDSGAFFIVLQNAQNAELYNMILRGGNEGGLDGIDITGNNVHVHDVEVTNKDECVTVKSPASNILVEQIYCNWSGGSAIGSLSTGTNIKNVYYKNIYTQNSNQMFMIKSSGGSGSVSNCKFENFIGHNNAYSLDINGYWSKQAVGSGAGVLFHDMSFTNWRGTCANGNQRSPVNIICPSGAPCYNINLTDVNIWTAAGSSETYKCENAYGTGACLKAGNTYSAYAVVTQTINKAPAGYDAPTMPGDLTAGFALNKEIPIPAVPTSYFPGLAPLKPVLK